MDVRGRRGRSEVVGWEVIMDNGGDWGMGLSSVLVA